MTRRGTWMVAAAVAVAALVAATVWVATDDGGESSRVTTDTTVTTVPTTATTLVEEATAIWPFPGDAAFDTPVMAAQSYAVEYLGFTDPLVGELQQGDARSGEVEVRPAANGPVTTVLVRQLSGEDTWSVLGSATAGIELAEPAALATISSPVRVAGRAVAFEGTVQVEVREDGAVDPIGAGFVTGGGDELRPFEGLIAFREPTASHGSIVLFTRSEEDGRLWEAASIRVALSTAGDPTAACGPLSGPAAPGEDEMAVTVYFTCGDPNASASAGSALLLSQLVATVFQLDEVDSVEYRLDGSCVDFNEWLQYSGCEPRSRSVDA